MEIDIRDQNVGCVGREPGRKGLWCSTVIRKWGNLQHTPFSETLRGHTERLQRFPGLYMKSAGRKGAKRVAALGIAVPNRVKWLGTEGDLGFPKESSAGQRQKDAEYHPNKQHTSPTRDPLRVDCQQHTRPE